MYNMTIKNTSLRVARDVVRRLATALARQTGKSEDETLSHVWGRLAIILQRANARILANRQPYHPPPIIDGVCESPSALPPTYRVFFLLVPPKKFKY